MLTSFLNTFETNYNYFKYTIINKLHNLRDLVTSTENTQEVIKCYKIYVYIYCIFKNIIYLLPIVELFFLQDINFETTCTI